MRHRLAPAPVRPHTPADYGKCGAVSSPPSSWGIPSEAVDDQETHPGSASVHATAARVSLGPCWCKSSKADQPKCTADQLGLQEARWPATTLALTALVTTLLVSDRSILFQGRSAARALAEPPMPSMRADELDLQDTNRSPSPFKAGCRVARPSSQRTEGAQRICRHRFRVVA
jgi:hypothetical protein